MKRRKFIISGGAAIGSASVAFGLLQEPTVALDFTVDGYDVSSKNISNIEDIDEVKIDFDSFTIGTEYLDKNKELTIELDLTIKDKGGQITTSSETYRFGGSSGNTFTNGSDNDFSDDFSTPAISVSNVGNNINLQYYKDNVYTDYSNYDNISSDSDVYELITLKGEIKATISHNDLPSDKTQKQEIYLSDDGDSGNGSYGLYDVKTRFGEFSNLFNKYEKEVIKDPNNNPDDPDDTQVDYLEGLLSYHVGSTGGFVTSSKKKEAIPRDSKNNRVSRESVIKYSTGDYTTSDYNTSA